MPRTFKLLHQQRQYLSSNKNLIRIFIFQRFELQRNEGFSSLLIATESMKMTSVGIIVNRIISSACPSVDVSQLLLLSLLRRRHAFVALFPDRAPRFPGYYRSLSITSNRSVTIQRTIIHLISCIFQSSKNLRGSPIRPIQSSIPRQVSSLDFFLGILSIFRVTSELINRRLKPAADASRLRARDAACLAGSLSVWSK